MLKTMNFSFKMQEPVASWKSKLLSIADVIADSSIGGGE